MSIRSQKYHSLERRLANHFIIVPFVVNRSAVMDLGFCLFHTVSEYVIDHGVIYFIS